MGLLKNQEAQLMLLAGFIIAIGVIVTSLMLNSIVFLSIVSVDTASGNEIIDLLQISEDEIKSAYRDAIAPGRNDTLKFNNFSVRMKNFKGNLSMLYALHGEGIDMNWDVSNWSNNRYAMLTKNGGEGAADWTLVESVKNLSVFELRNVSGTDLEVILTNQNTGAFLWSMKLENSSTVKINNSGGSAFYYTVDTSISLLNGSYKLNENVGNNISRVAIKHGNDASGRFNITGTTSNGRNFTRARDYVLNATVAYSKSGVRANITSPVTVPW